MEKWFFFFFSVIENLGLVCMDDGCRLHTTIIHCVTMFISDECRKQQESTKELHYLFIERYQITDFWFAEKVFTFFSVLWNHTVTVLLSGCYYNNNKKFKSEFLCRINIGFRLLHCWFHVYLQHKLPQIYSRILESLKPKLSCINRSFQLKPT